MRTVSVILVWLISFQLCSSLGSERKRDGVENYCQPIHINETHYDVNALYLESLSDWSLIHLSINIRHGDRSSLSHTKPFDISLSHVKSPDTSLDKITATASLLDDRVHKYVNKLPNYKLAKVSTSSQNSKVRFPIALLCSLTMCASC